MAAQTPPTHSDMTSSYNLVGSDRDSPETRDDEGEPPHVPPISPSALPYNNPFEGMEVGAQSQSSAAAAEMYGQGGEQVCNQAEEILRDQGFALCRTLVVTAPCGLYCTVHVPRG